jgi:hypothetical protein
MLLYINKVNKTSEYTGKDNSMYELSHTNPETGHNILLGNYYKTMHFAR